MKKFRGERISRFSGEIGLQCIYPALAEAVPEAEEDVANYSCPKEIYQVTVSV